MRIKDLKIRVLKIDGMWNGIRMGKIPDILQTRFIPVGRWNEPAPIYVPLVQIITDEDIEGVYFGRRGTREAVEYFAKFTVRSWKNELVGEDPLNRLYLFEKLRSSIRFHTPGVEALPVIDIALWDLAGKYAKMPVYKMIGGYRDKIPAYKSGGNLPSVKDFVEDALKAKEEGFHGYKDHAYKGPKKNREIAKAVREAVGEDFLLMHDAVQQYSYSEAVTVGRKLEELGYYWFEEPVHDYNLYTLGKLSSLLDIPILAGEVVHMAGGDSYIYHAAQYVRQQAVDIVRNKTSIAGITGALRVAFMADAYGVNTEMAGHGYAEVQVIAAIKNCEFFEAWRPGAHPIGIGEKNPITVKNGYVHVPQTPGVGMELQWDIIDENTLSEY